MMEKPEYTSVGQHDELDSDASATGLPIRGRASWFRRHIDLIRWTLLGCLALGYSVAVFNLGKIWEPGSPCFSEKMLNAPIIWEERTFLSGVHNNVIDPYARSSNPDGVEDAWQSIQEDRLAIISEAEKRRLPGHRDTAPAVGEDDAYVVLLEVFHQLHCLNSIRKSYYLNFTRSHDDESRKGFEAPGEHIDHCFSYLAQTLMCHADVGVMTTTWHEDTQGFTADFNVTKQCRNFETIQEWVKGRVAKHSPQEGHGGHEHVD
ncbi:hypothetical protein B0T16DRAFT_462808 [Cercophora newfieldiana]|uniref:Cyclochlorotine biosynthesis protein O n=1 Tax=Cercophora newfieldiana TaxID=92897 RepID=A0AA39XRW9_9PEZI|nr:hypothetical protein B0T16DRAFT_462808 [Cercophora newfieldiana]